MYTKNLLKLLELVKAVANCVHPELKKTIAQMVKFLTLYNLHLDKLPKTDLASI